MRPLMASFLERTVEGASSGVYDETRGVTLGRNGVPLVELEVSETLTKVRDEPVDDDRVVLETFTEVRDERTDEERPLAFETHTRVRNEPVDEERFLAETATAVRDEPTDDDRLGVVMPIAADSATGVVSF
ncbi:MAG: hypothetical protein FIA92_01290 [Chloroflexi bacterium]|nr:hypothetical protein [Chloroflexota bacterium]